MPHRARTSHKRAAWKAAGAALIALATVAVLYGVGVVYTAREHTLASVLPNARAARYPLAVSDLTPRQLEILLEVEDPNFFAHRGVDLSTPGAGITTITQGLVKNLYFERFRPGAAKIRQTLIARFALDPLMPKDEQLRLFLNTARFGRGARGFEQAARVHFDKPFERLAEDEYVALVAMLIAPSVFDPIAHPSRSAERVARIKRLIDSDYTPRGLMDLYYGRVDPESREKLPPFSYFASYYE